MATENEVVVIDMGLGTMSQDLERYCLDALREAAQQVLGQMRANIAGRGDTASFFDTGATHDSVQVTAPDRLTRDIGPTTEYAFYGEVGYTQTKAWGRTMKAPKVHAPIGFARRALSERIAGAFVDAIRRGVEKLGRPG